MGEVKPARNPPVDISLKLRNVIVFTFTCFRRPLGSPRNAAITTSGDVMLHKRTSFRGFSCVSACHSFSRTTRRRTTRSVSTAQLAERPFFSSGIATLSRLDTITSRNGEYGRGARTGLTATFQPSRSATTVAVAIFAHATFVSRYDYHLTPTVTFLRQRAFTVSRITRTNSAIVEIPTRILATR